MKNEAEMTLGRTTGEKLLFNLIYCYSLWAYTENNNHVWCVKDTTVLAHKHKSSHVLSLKPKDIETAVSVCMCVCHCVFYFMFVRESEHQEQCPIKKLQIELALPPLQNTKPLSIHTVPKEMWRRCVNNKQKIKIYN